MKWPTWLRNLWWLIITVFLTVIVLTRIIFGSEDPYESWKIVLLIIWFGMLVAPIFSEISIFGFKLKQELDRIKEDIKREISVMKAEIKTSFINQPQFNFMPEGRPIQLEDLVEKTTEGNEKRSTMEYIILNTLWVQQVNYYPDYSGVWSFRVHANTPVYLEFRTAGTNLIKEGLISETNEGQYYLTKMGFDYCKKHYTEFPPERLYQEIPIDTEKRKIALGEKEEN